jgi:histidinol-phosphate aminotransferase
MMCIVATQGIHMHCDAGMVNEALEEFANEIDVEFADRAAHERYLEYQAGSAGKIDHHPGERLVERNIGMAVTAHAFLVRDRLRQSLTERDAHVFDGVVGIDMQIAFRLDLEVDHAVTRNLIQHVIEEADPRGQRRLAAAIQIELHPDLGFKGITLDFGAAHRFRTHLRKRTRPMIPFRLESKPLSALPPCPMSRYWSDIAKSLTPYVPGEQPKLANLVKLNTNENPYGPSPKALAAIREQTGDSLRLYPDPESTALTTAVAATFGDIEPRQVFVGNGSDEVLAHVFMALLKHERPILFPDITYSFYPVYCQLYGVASETVPLTDAMEIRADDYLKPNGGIIFPNPNAPTGRALALGEIERIVGDNPDSVVVVDEAYVDFGAASAVPLVNRHPNLLVVQTLSKSRSLAGLRVGFAVGHADLIDALNRVKNSFNSYPLDRLAIAGATAALEDKEWFERTRQAVIRSRGKLAADLAALDFEVLPSAANFVFARHPRHDGGELARQLRQRSIVVRHFRLPRIDQYLRITVGTDEQCAALVAALKEILSA